MFATPEQLSIDRRFYDLAPAPEQSEFAEVVRDYARDHLKPLFLARDPAARTRATERSRELDLASLVLPPERGGLGADAATVMLVAEQLGRGDLNAAVELLMPMTTIHALDAFGLLEALSDEDVAGLADPVSGAVLLAEGRVDSGPLRRGAERRVSGRFSSVMARSIEERPLVAVAPLADGNGVTACVLPAGTATATRRAALGLDLLGPWEVAVSDAGPVALRVIDDPSAAGAALFHFRSRQAVVLCGALHGALATCAEYVFDYARERQSFGKPIIQHQAVAMRFAGVLTAVETLRLMLLEFSGTLDAGCAGADDLRRLLSHAVEVAHEVTRDGVQMMGGHGYVDESPVAGWYRNSLSLALLAKALCGPAD